MNRTESLLYLKFTVRNHEKPKDTIKAIVVYNCKNCAHQLCCRLLAVDLHDDEKEKYKTHPELIDEKDIGGDCFTCVAVKEDGSCIYLDPTGKCSIYENRPFVCRDFPCPNYRLSQGQIESLTFSKLSAFNIDPEAARKRFGNTMAAWLGGEEK